MKRSVNRVELIGRVGADPEMMYPVPELNVCTFWLVTTDFWRDHEGIPYQAVEWHRIVAWGRLAEDCYQFLVYGTLIYVEGRLATRAWQASDQQRHFVTELVLDDMIILSSEGYGPEMRQIELPENDIRADELYMPPSTPDLVTQRKLSFGM